MKNIVWVNVPGYEDCYMIANTGTVISKARIVQSKPGVTKRIKGRTLQAKVNNSGYLFVSLSKDGKVRNYYVHRLVAMAFLKKNGVHHKVNHKDGNKRNNTVENLEWVSHRENVQHAYKTGLNMNKGSRHFMATIVMDIELGLVCGSIREWAKARGLNESTARNILLGYSTKKGINMSKIIVIKKRKNGRRRQ